MSHSQQRTIAVIGSLNVDVVTVVPRLAEPGETMTATSINTGFGGKGANQGVAAARLASSNIKTMMIGNVGNDNFGRDYKNELVKEGIDESGVIVVDGETTGTAVVTVETSGENRIYIAPGANYARPEPEHDNVPSTTVAVFQLEIPFEKAMRNIKTASQNGAYVIVNPAPARALPHEIYQYIDCIVLNETEAETLSDPQQSWNEYFFGKGIKELVILTLGSHGVQWATVQNRSPSHIPARKVEVVDTTAAGDTFVGGLAARIAEHGAAQADVQSHIEFANTAASLSVQKAGAMSSIPRLDDVLAAT